MRPFLLLLLLAAPALADDAETEWAKSCAHPDTDGLCVRAMPRSKGCRATTDVQTVPRADTSHHALAALRETAKGSDAAAWRARRLIADASLEDFVAIPLPAVDRAKDDAEEKKVLITYVELKRKGLDALQGQYVAILSATTAPAAEQVLATERIGRAYAQFASDLDAMALPSSIKTGDARQEYCKLLDEQTAPLVDKARQAFDQCARTATTLKVAAPELCVSSGTP